MSKSSSDNASENFRWHVSHASSRFGMRLHSILLCCLPGELLSHWVDTVSTQVVKDSLHKGLLRHWQPEPFGDNGFDPRAATAREGGPKTLLIGMQCNRDVLNQPAFDAVTKPVDLGVEMPLRWPFLSFTSYSTWLASFLVSSPCLACMVNAWRPKDGTRLGFPAAGLPYVATAGALDGREGASAYNV